LRLQRIGAARTPSVATSFWASSKATTRGLGQGPARAVHDSRAEERGDIKPGDTLIEATSGNTGIALAMAAAIKGYRMVLIMPEDLSIERAQTMKAFGAELMLTPKSGGMEYARDLADKMQKRKARARCWTSLPTPTTRASTTKPPARAVGADGWAHHPFRERHGHHGHHHRRVALS
jgi:hypothetical protein